MLRITLIFLLLTWRKDGFKTCEVKLEANYIMKSIIRNSISCILTLSLKFKTHSVYPYELSIKIHLRFEYRTHLNGTQDNHARLVSEIH